MNDDMTTQIAPDEQRFEESTSVTGDTVVASAAPRVVFYSSASDSEDTPNESTRIALEEAMNPQHLDSFQSVDDLFDDLKS